jgi:hypothetical protein
MATPVKLDDLLDAFDWVSSSFAGSFDCSAFVHRLTGAVVWVGEGVDDDPPEDVDDGSVYLAVPDKSDLGLGRELALQFVEEYFAFVVRAGAAVLRAAGCLRAIKGFAGAGRFARRLVWL